MLTSKVQKNIIPCKHCGDKCFSDAYKKDDAIFCCLGCKTVYEWLNNEGLQYYYAEPGNDGNRKWAMTNMLRIIMQSNLL